MSLNVCPFETGQVKDEVLIILYSVIGACRLFLSSSLENFRMNKKGFSLQLRTDVHRSFSTHGVVTPRNNLHEEAVTALRKNFIKMRSVRFLRLGLCPTFQLRTSTSPGAYDAKFFRLAAKNTKQNKTERVHLVFCFYCYHCATFSHPMNDASALLISLLVLFSPRDQYGEFIHAAWFAIA